MRSIEMRSTIIGALSVVLGGLLGFLLNLWKDKKKQKVQSKHAFLLLSNFFDTTNDLLEKFEEFINNRPMMFYDEISDILKFNDKIRYMVINYNKTHSKEINSRNADLIDYTNLIYEESKSKIEYFLNQTKQEWLLKKIDEYLSNIYSLIYIEINIRENKDEKNKELIHDIQNKIKNNQQEIKDMIKKEFKIK